MSWGILLSEFDCCYNGADVCTGCIFKVRRCFRLGETILDCLDAAEAVCVYCDRGGDWYGVYASLDCGCFCDKVVTDGDSPMDVLWVVFI